MKFKTYFILACSVLFLLSQTQLPTAQTSVPGLVHLYSGNGNGNDAVGGANGTLGGTTAFGAGLNGQAFSFNGAQSSIVSLPVSINPGDLPQMTMGMFVKLRSIPNNLGWVIGHDNGGFDRSLNLHDSRYGGVGAHVAGGTGGFSPYPSSLPLSLNQWHCVAVAYNAGAGTATFYLDGVVQTVLANPGPGLANTTLGGLQIFGGHTVDALVDEVFIFNRALTPQEIDQVCADLANPNQPPDCSTAAPSVATLWPPNHKMVNVNVLGVTDPDGDPVTITVTGITQDEPVNGTGDGDTGPDGAGVGTSTAQVRAERAGSKKTPGNGRVYQISFTADDGNGGTCDGSVKVCVPHDQGKGNACIDDGQNYNSLAASKPVAAEFAPEAELAFGVENYPNPFNPSTTIRYTLPEASNVRLTIYNVLGQEVRTLINAAQSRGIYSVQWDGRDAYGRQAATGVYIYRLEAGANVATRNMIFAK